MAGTSTRSTRFTLRLPNDLHEEGEARALGTGKSVAQLIVDALRQTWNRPLPEVTKP
jgi:predicted HicB family RNase H-like nuclease